MTPENEINQLRARVLHYNHLYYVECTDDIEIRDSVYDELFARLVSLVRV